MDAKSRENKRVWTGVAGRSSTQIGCTERVPKFESDQMAVITGVKISRGLRGGVRAHGNKAYCKQLQPSSGSQDANSNLSQWFNGTAGPS